ncbi:hypothetical protein MCOR27_001334 [Pyricularia oryzae]|uniref:P-loop containing nucleoside triphosphate hydrolase protein n=5 Tax=Pyricularia TaxID=48558 RepID=A0ABQ8NRR8_PYRGI|nr:uncharacterized protein MGG_06461 [Pyricularia oryzae 70-15]ELQ41896.1 hypothetical protein OOU_Y34scaffold00247g30 [Pyricularia oryzae Y34]KAH8843481.1 hypothetical protein MCOR01_004282 [Pyricularia oryzae]KAI6299857.1 hypothetical protein MCOR33_004344 [Pyricularia grisea]EHA50786.1 hypothetical protein MGG_06461 [Pyricularia oryzae 70-15]KAI6269803.1 hypothetical protein MCOR26_008559 [Pyricularia oryzae]
MTSRPIFVATHPRACSTAFERVFMTRRDILECAHEPFGDAFYYGPERLSERYEKDEASRLKSGFADVTYRDVLHGMKASVPEGKRLFIKDITHYLCPPDGKPAKIAPSLAAAAKPMQNGKTTNGVNGAATNGNQVNGAATNGNHENGTTTNGNPVNGTATNGNHVNGAAANGNHVNGAAPNGYANATSEPGNPSVMPLDMLREFHFTFLIRHPRRSIPSYYRCTIPPLDEKTGFKNFMPSEAGYIEVRNMFDYLLSQGIIGPHKAGEEAPANSSGVSITVIDADDLLDKPAAVIEAFCKEVGIDYSPDMLKWEDEENQQYALDAFAKWNGFHDDVIGSTYLKPRTHGCKTVTRESEDEEWRQKYGEEGRRIIRDCVDTNIPHYEYLKSFAIKF